MSSPADAFFAALLPLPRPWVATATDAAPPAREAFRRHDVGFRNGRTLVLLTFRDVARIEEERAPMIRRLALPLFGDPRAALDAIWPDLQAPDAPDPPMGSIRPFADLRHP